VSRATDFWNRQRYQLRGSELIRIDVPSDASSISIHREWLLIDLRTDWTFGTTTYPAGSLLAANYDEFISGARELRVIFEPDEHTCLHQYAWTRDRLLLVTLADVLAGSRSSHRVVGSANRCRAFPRRPTAWSSPSTTPATNSFWTPADSKSPSRLLRGTGRGPLEQIKTAPSFFDADNLTVEQYFGTSEDGTAIPYFVVRPGGTEKSGPTLLYGYGGFENSNTPGYSAVLGRLWLARGGTYALANIRGGGEYGPRWHTQAMREGRHLVAEDFAAVATDLVDRGITTVPQLGAQGGSNGGLLMGIMLTQYPELFGALVCQVPLLDMRRFHLLLAGASWVAEYGNPDDPADWEFIAEYSPYHNISADTDYPPVLITTSTRDDRVHPGHARKMTAALEAADRRVWYYEKHRGRSRRCG